MIKNLRNILYFFYICMSFKSFFYFTPIYVFYCFFQCWLIVHCAKISHKNLTWKLHSTPQRMVYKNNFWEIMIWYIAVKKRGNIHLFFCRTYENIFRFTATIITKIHNMCDNKNWIITLHDANYYLPVSINANSHKKIHYKS